MPNYESKSSLHGNSNTHKSSTGASKRKRVVKKWTKEEDDKMLCLIKLHGLDDWCLISNYMEDRNGKQCRERYCNHLDPTIKKDPWTPEEDVILEQMHNKYGNKWSEIARYLPGRSDNSVKNRWNGVKRLNIAPVVKMQAIEAVLSRKEYTEVQKEISRELRDFTANNDSSSPSTCSPSSSPSKKRMDKSFNALEKEILQKLEYNKMVALVALSPEPCMLMFGPPPLTLNFKYSTDEEIKSVQKVDNKQDRFTTPMSIRSTPLLSAEEALKLMTEQPIPKPVINNNKNNLNTEAVTSSYNLSINTRNKRKLSSTDISSSLLLQKEVSIHGIKTRKRGSSNSSATATTC
jgi:hypothetical protein